MNVEQIIQKHRHLLTRMKNDRIFSISANTGKIYLNEECDDYFSHELNKNECVELSKLFYEIADTIH